MFCWTNNTPKPDFFLEKRKISSKTQKIKNVQKYAKISDTPFDQRSLIHLEAWFPGGPRIPKNPIFLKNGKNHPKHKYSKLRYSKISDTPFDKRSLIHLEVWFPPCFVRQNQQKNNFFCVAILDQFQTTMFKCQTTSFHYFSPRIPKL